MLPNIELFILLMNSDKLVGDELYCWFWKQ